MKDDISFVQIDQSMRYSLFERSVMPTIKTQAKLMMSHSLLLQRILRDHLPKIYRVGEYRPFRITVGTKEMHSFIDK